MEKINRLFEEKIGPIATKIAGQRHLVALRDGMILSMPVMIIGSFFIIFNAFPSETYQTFMVSVFGEGWNGFVWSMIFPATLSLVAVISLLGITYYLVEGYGQKGLPAAILALSAFLVLTPCMSGSWSIGSFGTTSLFTAMIIAVLSAEVYWWLIKHKITIKLPDTVPPNVATSFTALVPAAVIITLAFIIKIGFMQTSYGDLNNFIFTLIQTPLKTLGTSYAGNMIFEVIAHVLWTVGIHGHNIINSVRGPLVLATSLENLDLFEAGLQLKNIITQEFVTYVYIGGAGSTLPLACLMAFAAKSKQVKEVGKLAIVPGIFNINEPIIFGLPIIMNPFMMIPFLIVPLILTTIAYFGMAWGIFPLMTGVQIPWTMPKILVGYLGTNGSIMGALLVVINFAVAGVLYYPFFKLWDNQKYKEEQSIAE